MTDVNIINLALVKQGIQFEAVSRSQDVKPIRVINRVYDAILAAMLETFAQHFSITRESLAQVVGDPLYEWTCQYLLPGACVFLLEIEGLKDADYVVEGRTIFCHQADGINIKYCRGAVEEALFSNLFCNAFAARLAYETSEANTGLPALAKRLKEDYAGALALALVHNAKHGRGLKATTNPYVDVRTI